MADGYARASGKPGVAFIITGPGITNVATPIGEAYTDGSPVFVVSANVERPYLDAMRGNLHDLKDQMGLMAAVTQWNSRVMDPADGPEAIAEGLHRLTSGRTRPALMWGYSDPMVAIIACVSPETSAMPDGPPPLYGTCTILR